MFPAAAAAVALALDRNGQLAIPPRMLRLPWWIVLPGTIALFAVIVNLARAPSTFVIVAGATLVTALFTLAARAAGEDQAAAWLTTSVAGFALFIAYTFGVLMPHLAKGLAGSAHRRRRRAAAPLCHRAGRRPRLP